MINFTIVGRCGQDAELKKGKDEKEFLKVSLASTTRRGEKEETIWVDVISSQVKLQPYIKKGKLLGVSSTNVSITSYNDKPQVTVYNPDIQLLDKKQEENG